MFIVQAKVQSCTVFCLQADDFDRPPPPKVLFLCICRITFPLLSAHLNEYPIWELLWSCPLLDVQKTLCGHPHLPKAQHPTVYWSHPLHPLTIWQGFGIEGSWHKIVAHMEELCAAASCVRRTLCGPPLHQKHSLQQLTRPPTRMRAYHYSSFSDIFLTNCLTFSCSKN